MQSVFAEEVGIHREGAKDAKLRKLALLSLRPLRLRGKKSSRAETTCRKRGTGTRKTWSQSPFSAGKFSSAGPYFFLFASNFAIHFSGSSSNAALQPEQHTQNDRPL